MNSTNPTAPGFKTTEFWLSLLGMVLTYLSVRGIIRTTDINPIIDAVMQVYGGAVGLVTVWGIVHSYIKSRTSIKTSLIQQGQTTSV